MTLFPTQIFLTPWPNSRSQVSFLSHLIILAPGLFANPSLRQVIPTADARTPSTLAATASSSPFNALDFIKVLVRESENKSCLDLVEDILETGRRDADILLLGIVLVFGDVS